jgi:hypothetical protein
LSDLLSTVEDGSIGSGGDLIRRKIRRATLTADLGIPQLRFWVKVGRGTAESTQSRLSRKVARKAR